MALDFCFCCAIIDGGRLCADYFFLAEMSRAKGFGAFNLYNGGINIYKELIQENFNIEVKSIKILADHMQSKIFLVEAQTGKYVLKEVNSDFLSHPENEGALLEYLYSHGINVARLILTKNNEYIFSYGEKQFHLQEFIDGEIISLNTATDWYLKKSAQMLGEIQRVLRGYNKLPVLFDKDFLDKSTVFKAKQSILDAIKQAEKENKRALVIDLNERLKHIEKIACFKFDLNKLTYSNSHGDYYVNQIITRNQEMIVIDWTGACFLPVCFEVMMSYTYADSECKGGTIHIKRFKTYLNEYLKHFPLSSYDLKMMPYFYYYQLCICTFVPPYDDLPNDYLQITKLCNNLMNWLHINVDNLSNDLCAV